MTGTFNPEADDNATSVRPARTIRALGVRRWFTDILRTRISGVDLNSILAQFYTAGDAYAVADTEGAEDYLLRIIRAAARDRLTAARTYYVRTDGVDTNDGLANTVAGAFKTIQKALNTAAALDLNTNTVTIQVADGNYAEAVAANREFLNGAVILRGNTAAPGNCVISPAAGAALSIYAALSVEGFKFTPANGYGLYVGANGRVSVTGAVEFGACALGQVTAAQGGIVTLSAAYTISGGGAYHMQALRGGSIALSNVAVTLTGTPAFTTGFAVALIGGSLQMVPSAPFAGGATGPRYQVEDGCSISIPAGVDMASYFPGSTMGGPKPGYDAGRAFRNLLNNGSGRLQLGPAGAVADDAYGLHNRWYALTQSGSITPSTLADVQDGLPSMIRLTNTTATAQRMGYAQIIEGVNCKHLRGRKVTLSGFARLNTTTAVRFTVLEWTGTEDAVTSDVVSNWASAVFTPGNFFNAANLTVAGSGTITPGTDVLKPYALTVQLSSAFTNLIVMIHTNSTAAATGGTMDITAQLEDGVQASALERRPLAVEELKCARYYQTKTLQSQNGARHVPLLPMRAAPVVAITGGPTAASITRDGFEMSHTAAVAAAITASAEL